MAFVAYWGIVLFGYDRCIDCPSWKGRNVPLTNYFSLSGVAGGIVQSKFFQIKFGVRPAEGPAEQSRIDNVSANVVSVLQCGAFFGALSSAPVSGGSRVFPQLCSLHSGLMSLCKCSLIQDVIVLADAGDFLRAMALLLTLSNF